VKTKFKLINLILLLFLANAMRAQNSNILTSPDKNISIEIIPKEKIYYTGLPTVVPVGVWYKQSHRLSVSK